MSAAQLPAFAPTLAGLGLVALGGAVGAVLRYGVTQCVEQRCGQRLPWGTLAVNLSAALLAGGLLALFNLGANWPAGWLLWIVGLLGSYSTVSSFSLQMLLLQRAGEGRRAVSYLMLSTVGSLALVAAGYCLGMWLGALWYV